MRKTFIKIFKKRKNLIAVLVVSFSVFLILNILPVYEILSNFFGLEGVSTQRRYEVFYQYVFETFFEKRFFDKFLLVSLSLLTAVNILLFVVFAKRQQKFLSKRSFLASVSGIFLGLFGVGCLSCGALVLAPLITVLGLGAYTQFFVHNAILISVIGVFFVLLSSLYLLYKISQSLVCK